MIDSHCHLDRVADLEAALANDLSAMVTVGTDAARSERALELALTHDRVWATTGLHPTEASHARDPSVRARIEALAIHPRVVAVGETGIDLYWETDPIDVQLQALRWQIELAERCDKAVVLHVRDAHGNDEASRRAARAVRESGYRRGILHCTNGHPDLLEAGLETGWFVSFAGNLTYPKAHLVHAAARDVPDDRLLVETDSPFLAPVPRRGRPNVPGNVTHTAAYLAELRGVDLHALEGVLDHNARRVYALPSPP